MARLPDWDPCLPAWGNGASVRLEPGRIFAIASDSGIDVPTKGPKRPILCPFHDDHRPSAFLSELNIFYCSVCTPEAGWSAKRFSQEIGAPWPDGSSRGLTPPPQRKLQPTAPTAFTPAIAQSVWALAHERAQDDAKVELDGAAYRYLARRELIEAWELRLVGILHPEMTLPEAIAWWPDAGYRVVVPVYDQRGKLTNVQARCIQDASRKVLFPKGSTAQGTVFANARGLDLLRGSSRDRSLVVLAEGLTDFLALSIVVPGPLFAAPGTGCAAAGIGAWVKGRCLILALDDDEAGVKAIQPTAKAAFNHGASRVFDIAWPDGCKDACDALVRLGLSGFDDFVANCMSNG